MPNVIDYIPGETILHRLNPVTKLGIAVAIIVTIFLAQSYPLLIGLILLSIGMGALAGGGARVAALMRLLVPVACIMLALQVAVVRTGAPVIGPITSDGLVTGSKACLRLIGIALPLMVVLMATRLTDLANACVEQLHVPYRYAFTFTTALRFVPVFTQEMHAIMEAQTARGVEFDTKNPFKKLSLMLPVCVPLLVTSVGKTDATALAAEQRGFYLRTRASSFKRYPFAARDVAAGALCCILVVLGILF